MFCHYLLKAKRLKDCERDKLADLHISLLVLKDRLILFKTRVERYSSSIVCL